jgi:hypothetical protein
MLRGCGTQSVVKRTKLGRVTEPEERTERDVTWVWHPVCSEKNKMLKEMEWGIVDWTNLAQDTTLANTASQNVVISSTGWGSI